MLDLENLQEKNLSAQTVSEHLISTDSVSCNDFEPLRSIVEGDDPQAWLQHELDTVCGEGWTPPHNQPQGGDGGSMRAEPPCDDAPSAPRPHGERRRQVHRLSEKKRRDELKRCFHQLARVVPLKKSLRRRGLNKKLLVTATIQYVQHLHARLRSLSDEHARTRRVHMALDQCIDEAWRTLHGSSSLLPPTISGW
jgi:hypothetical protein